MGVIESGAYKAEVDRLMADPIIREMEASLQAGVDLDAWDFISVASDVFQARGGDAYSIGGPARAIKAIREAR